MNFFDVLGLILLIIVIVLIVLTIPYCVRIIPQSNAYVIERLGTYSRTLDQGPHLLVPIIDRISSKVSLKEIVKDFEPQPVITKDNVTMQIDTVVYFQITDPKLYTYGIHNPINAIENLTATTLRNIIGDLELDETLTSRDIINSQMRSILDVATDPWGIKVHRVEVKNIIPPRDIQEAMEKQMRAERERREAILRAEGEKRSKVLTAEGEKEAMILKATAQKEATVAEAEGEAKALKVIYDAQAYGIEAIKKADPTQAYLTLKSYETMEKVADGQSTKIIIPSELQNVASALTAANELLFDKSEPTKTLKKESKKNE